MTKITAPVAKATNGSSTATKAVADVVKEVLNPSTEKKAEVQKALPVPEPAKELTMAEKIIKIETLQLLVEKRTKLVQTRAELDRFKTASSDFNCSMRLNDSDGNVFTTSFTPGIKKVLDYLKGAFEGSIREVEDEINF
ncbi:MAG: hypothetical protein NTU98_06355 [Bacteroidetes bacterium]|nr:hypothetical protein [Bacteroidota bacterium]